MHLNPSDPNFRIHLDNEAQRAISFAEQLSVLHSIALALHLNFAKRGC